MASKKNEYLHIFSNGRVAKINATNAEIVWEIKLKEHGLAYATIGSIKVEHNKIFIGASGKLICLNEKDGSFVWKNDLKGWGYSYVIFSNTNTEPMASAAAAAAASAAV
jgi:outer membrane protein assembly factor BamB